MFYLIEIFNNKNLLAEIQENAICHCLGVPKWTFELKFLSITATLTKKTFCHKFSQFLK